MKKKYICLFGILLLVLVSLLAPSLVLAIQDNVRCGEIVVAEMENPDITSFNTGYEKDLYQRLFRFAAELQEGKQFYVAKQEITDTEAVMEFLYSDAEGGLYSEQLVAWIDAGIISEEIWSSRLVKAEQYVVYGEDFSKGVNFIIWNLELLCPEGGQNVRLLADAETGDFYGIAVNNETENTDYNIKGILTLLDYMGVEGEANATEFLSEFGYAVNYLYGGYKGDELGDMRSLDDGNGLLFDFVYRNIDNTSKLQFCVKVSEVEIIYQTKKELACQVQNFVLGFPEIYELISGFVDNK